METEAKKELKKEIKAIWNNLTKWESHQEMAVNGKKVGSIILCWEDDGEKVGKKISCDPFPKRYNYYPIVLKEEWQKFDNYTTSDPSSEIDMAIKIFQRINKCSPMKIIMNRLVWNQIQKHPKYNIVSAFGMITPLQFEQGHKLESESLDIKEVNSDFPKADIVLSGDEDCVKVVIKDVVDSQNKELYGEFLI